MFDLLIKGGSLIDGTGNPGYYGAVGIKGEQLWIIRGDTSAMPANTVIEATGRVVCPGFIDAHTHCGLMLLANPRHEPKVFQGVTTEFIGIDGIAWAPVKSYEDLRKHIRLYSGADGTGTMPGAGLIGGRKIGKSNQLLFCKIHSLALSSLPILKARATISPKAK